MNKNNNENNKTIYKTHSKILPNWIKYVLLLLAVLFLAAVICTTVYGYSLIGKALDTKQYTTALALSSPEIGTGIGYLTKALF